MNGSNHWKIPEIISYEPKSNSKFQYKMKKNVYGYDIKGRPTRVIAQLIQLHLRDKIKSNDVWLNLKWKEIVDILTKIKVYLWRWKVNGYKMVDYDE